MDDFFRQLWDIIVTLIDPRNLTNPDAFKAALNQPGVFWAAFVAVNFIVFAETGLLFFLLPGDSLLVIIGFVAQLSGWNVWLLIGALCLSAIIGEMVGYWIGAKTGPAIFARPDGRFFKQRYLKDAHEFFERHGGKAIIFARFVPFARTAVPVIAGAARMDYKQFLIYNLIGALAWILFFVLLGYYGIAVIDAFLQNALGRPDFTLARHLDKIVIVIVLLSISPMLWRGWKSWRAKRRAPLSVNISK
jgi:membrane-associated protein